MSSIAEAPKTIRSTIPARLDRLSWSPFHTRMVCGLGAAWILDGLQITIASSVTGVLIQPDTLDMTSSQVGLIASVYLVGQVVGALYFGRKSDQLGRKRLLVITLLLYLLGKGWRRSRSTTVAGSGSPGSTGRGSSRAWESAASTRPSTPRSTR